MQTKHTPGPWVAVAHYVRTPLDAQGGGWMVADCRDVSLPREQVQANAHLIAAAPELLEALEQAFDFPPDFFDRSDDELEQITVSGRHLRMVRAAIAKATGAEA